VPDRGRPMTADAIAIALGLFFAVSLLLPLALSSPL
jgi:hypothetical protein